MQLDTWFLSGWSSVGVNAFETEIMDNGFHRIYSHGKRMADAGIPKDLKPNPIDPFSLKRAEGLLAQLRAIERDRGRALCGDTTRPKFKRKPGASLPKPTLVYVEPRENTETFIAPDIQRLLYRRFEETCRRRRLTIPEDLVPALYNLLLMDLVANSAIVKAPTALLIDATVLHGAMHRLADEYLEFAGSEDLFRQVVLVYVSDPWSAFQRIRKTVQRLEKDARFARFRRYPSLFLEAAVNHPANPEAFLLRILKSVERLENDGRFAEFRGSPSVYVQAVLNYPADPEGALVRWIFDSSTG